jgi:hypothetical protein
MAFFDNSDYRLTALRLALNSYGYPMVMTGKFNRRFSNRTIAILAAASFILAGCWFETTTRSTPRVVVFGESLVDVGTL